MEIRILRDGIEIGPFTEDTVQNLLKQGSIAITDLAWRAGMPQWVPLANLLYATDTPPPPPGSVPPPPPPPGMLPHATQPPQEEEAAPVVTDPATAKQKAFLTYMGIPFPPEIDREAASILVNEAMENPRDAARLNRWNKERLRLHPDLFAAEIQAAKEQRAQHFFEVCEAEGTQWFTKVTKAHCQVLVGYLDVHHPNWDADPGTATTSYFFPAIAEKFPQLLTKEAKGRFKYPEGPKVAKELVNRSPVAVKARRPSPAMALARGVFFGVLILGMLWFVNGLLTKNDKPAGKNLAQANTAGGTAPSTQPPDPAGAPPADPAAPLAQNTPSENPAGAATPATENSGEMKPEGDPSMTAEATASTPASTADPLAPASEPLNVPPPPAPPGTRLILTKPVEIKVGTGKISLRPGTPVVLVQQDGKMLTVKFAGRDLIKVEATSTNLGAEPHPATQPAVPAPAAVPAAPAPAPATPAPAGESLFGPPKTPTPGTVRPNPSSDL